MQRSSHEFGCPNCGSFNIRRSRARSIREYVRRAFTYKRPFRCRNCHWRGWLVGIKYPVYPASGR